MNVDQKTTEKLWGIVSRLPFQSPYLIELNSENKISPRDYFENSVSQFVLELIKYDMAIVKTVRL